MTFDFQHVMDKQQINVTVAVSRNVRKSFILQFDAAIRFSGNVHQLIDY